MKVWSWMNIILPGICLGITFHPNDPGSKHTTDKLTFKKVKWNSFNFDITKVAWWIFLPSLWKPANWIFLLRTLEKNWNWVTQPDLSYMAKQWRHVSSKENVIRTKEIRSANTLVNRQTELLNCDRKIEKLKFVALLTDQKLIPKHRSYNGEISTSRLERHHINATYQHCAQNFHQFLHHFHH